jgi:hypothetical protein
MKTDLPRLVSVVTHPFIVSAIATLISADLHHASPILFRALVIILTLLGLVAVGFALWQVRTGRWKHIDAVHPVERKVLNIFLAALLLSSSILAWKYFPEPELAYGLLTSGVAIVIALVLARWLKISLHSCFASLATGILWPSFLALLTGITISAVVYWSRLVLKRHTVAELAVGSLIGATCAMGYHWLDV